MRAIRVAICQTVCLSGDRRGNLARIALAVAEAAQLRPNVVCLPEMAIYGWVNPEAHDRAHPIPGEDSDRLCELARKHEVFLCVGLAEKEGKHLYDTALLIDEAGRILLKHRKINLLSELMTPPYTPGQDVAISETRYGRIGMLICADTHDPALLAQMAELKPDLVLVPYGYAAKEGAWPTHGQELERVVANAARAVGAPVVGTNLVSQITHGPWAGMTYAGHSVVADKNGRLVATGKDFDRNVQVVPVSV